jgi:hypothetical protein
MGASLLLIVSGFQDLGLRVQGSASSARGAGFQVQRLRIKGTEFDVPTVMSTTLIMTHR